MSFALPFGLCASSIVAVRRAVAEHDQALALDPGELLGAGHELALAVLHRDLEHLAGRQAAR